MFRAGGRSGSGVVSSSSLPNGHELVVLAHGDPGQAQVLGNGALALAPLAPINDVRNGMHVQSLQICLVPLLSRGPTPVLWPTHDWLPPIPGG